MIWVKRFLILALIALVVIQFIRPDKNEGDYASLDSFIAETKPSQEVQGILKTACYDCHSNQTKYPWYAEVAPVSLWLDQHIEDGKRHLNFADWDKYSAKRKDHKLNEVIDEVSEGDMPLASYTLIHHDADLTDQQVDMLLNWAKVARLNYSSGLQPQ